MEAQRQLREGLGDIERVQAGLFGHLERMAAHLIALEAIVAVSAKQQAVPSDDVIQIITGRITSLGLDESAASTAIEVANSLIAPESTPSPEN